MKFNQFLPATYNRAIARLQGAKRRHNINTAAADQILYFGGSNLATAAVLKSDRINSVVTIIFEAHATSVDNEKDIASGHTDPELSELGVKQARELGERYASDRFDAIFCSDLKRSYKTAEIAFQDRGSPIIKDQRLRECDYGDLTQHPSKEVDVEKPKRISVPFSNGESYEQTLVRMKAFLQDLLKNYDGKKVMIIGHRATQYGLEHWIKGIPLLKAVTAPWQWQPGWEYKLEKI